MTASPGLVNGLVSTIIPVFNRPTQLEESVASVIAQNYRPIEVIIVDDGSTDGITPCVADQLQANWPELVRVLHQSNAGPGAAREAGRLAARGEYIQYLDSDDVLLPGKFTAQVQALRDSPDADVAYGVTFFRDANGMLHPAPHKGTGVMRTHMFPDFLNERWWETATPLYRRRVTDAAGPWLASNLEEDWEYDCRVAAVGGCLAYVEQPVSEHRDHGGGRLSRGQALDPARLRMRYIAQLRIWDHAQRARLPEFAKGNVQVFARSAFLLARQCAAAGLNAETHALLRVALGASRAGNGSTLDIRAFSALVRIFGAEFSGRAATGLDRLRSGRRPHSA